jgi:hypothetical protein
MATGSRAFHKDTGAETLSMIIRGEPERPLDLNPSLPLPLVWIIERCPSKDPADRYVSTRRPSPGWSVLGAVTRIPRTNEPFLLPRSCTVTETPRTVTARAV